MEKKLAKPAGFQGKGGTQLSVRAEQIEKKREIARKQALDKVRARTLARQQQLAERIATATEQLAAGIEEASSAAEELSANVGQIAKGASEASSAAEESRAAINQTKRPPLWRTKTPENRSNA